MKDIAIVFAMIGLYWIGRLKGFRSGAAFRRRLNNEGEE